MRPVVSAAKNRNSCQPAERVFNARSYEHTSPADGCRDEPPVWYRVSTQVEHRWSSVGVRPRWCADDRTVWELVATYAAMAVVSGTFVWLISYNT